MRKLIFIIVLFFSTSVLSENNKWKYYTDSELNTLRHWISKGFTIVHTDIWDSYPHRDYIHTLTNTNRPEFAIMCIVSTTRGEPEHTICYREFMGVL